MSRNSRLALDRSGEEPGVVRDLGLRLRERVGDLRRRPLPRRLGDCPSFKMAASSAASLSSSSDVYK